MAIDAACSQGRARKREGSPHKAVKKSGTAQVR